MLLLASTGRGRGIHMVIMARRRDVHYACIGELWGLHVEIWLPENIM